MNAVSMQLMKRKSFSTGRVVGLLAGSLWIAGVTLTARAVDVFTVDPSQSYVSVSGSVVGNALEPQGAGSLTTHCQGSLLVEVGANAIQFPGQSQVVALDSGNWEPLADGSDGGAPANFGGAASFFLTDGVAAARHVQADMASGSIVLVNGQFDTAGITFLIPAGAGSSLAYRVTGAIDDSGAITLDGQSATGQVAQGSIATVGGQAVLTLPIRYTFKFSLVSNDDTTVNLTGQLVATRSL